MTYRFNRLIRWTTIILAFFALSYGIYVVLTKLGSNTPSLQKILPYAIIFLAINSLVKNFFTLNTIKISSKYLYFGKLGRKKVIISLSSIKEISLAKGRVRAVSIKYICDGRDKIYMLPTGFPRVFDALKEISKACQNAKIEEDLRKIIF